MDLEGPFDARRERDTFAGHPQTRLSASRNDDAPRSQCGCARKYDNACPTLVD